MSFLVQRFILAFRFLYPWVKNTRYRENPLGAAILFRLAWFSLLVLILIAQFSWAKTQNPSWPWKLLSWPALLSCAGYWFTFKFAATCCECKSSTAGLFCTALTYFSATTTKAYSNSTLPLLVSSSWSGLLFQLCTSIFPFAEKPAHPTVASYLTFTGAFLRFLLIISSFLTFLSPVFASMSTTSSFMTGFIPKPSL